MSKRMTVSEYAVYYQWAHEFLESMSNDKKIEANRLADGCISLVEYVLATQLSAYKDVAGLLRRQNKWLSTLPRDSLRTEQVENIKILLAETKELLSKYRR